MRVEEIRGIDERTRVKGHYGVSSEFRGKHGNNLEGVADGLSTGDEFGACGQYAEANSAFIGGDDT